MNPYKTQAIQIALNTEINHGEIKEWITGVINKCAAVEPWMDRVLLACDQSDEALRQSLNAVPFSLPSDDLLEKLLRKPLTTKDL